MKTSLNLSLEEKTEEKAEKEVVTTLEELEGYAIVKSMIYGVIDASRVTYRDNRSYCNVLLDNNINKTVCRLYFNTAQKYIAFLVDKKEVKTPINCLNDIFNFKEQIINKVAEIEKAYSKK